MEGKICNKPDKERRYQDKCKVQKDSDVANNIININDIQLVYQIGNYCFIN